MRLRLDRAGFFSVWLLMAVLLPVLAGAQAKDVPVAVHDRQLSELYEALLLDPADRDLNLQYATRAAELGDFEAAIPPMERILVAEPDNNWLKLQLGAMYHALGSDAMAEMYVREVLDPGSATKKEQDQANALLRVMKQGNGK